MCTSRLRKTLRAVFNANLAIRTFSTEAPIPASAGRVPSHPATTKKTLKAVRPDGAIVRRFSYFWRPFFAKTAIF